MKIKITSLAVALLLLLSCVFSFAACGEKGENKITVATSAPLSGDFRWPGFSGSSVGSGDAEINKLISGYSTMETNQVGEYVWNQTAVKSHSAEKASNGDLVITVEINSGLKFSDGTELKAQNYIAPLLAFSSPVVREVGHSGNRAEMFSGFESFSLFDGTANVKAATKEFSGIRLLSDYSFSVTLDSSRGYYPYYYSDSYAALTPYPMALLFGDSGIELKDDGAGAYISSSWYAKLGDAYLMADHLKTARFDVTKYPFSGAYTISEWDKENGICTLKLNPNFAGNFEGRKPEIETVVYKTLVPEAQIAALRAGEIDIISDVNGAVRTKAALALVDEENGKLAYSYYQRAGYGKLQLECDFGPTMFTSVRHALAYIIDTEKLVKDFGGDYAAPIYGPYYPDLELWLDTKGGISINKYSYSPENAIAALEEGGWVYNSEGGAYVAGKDGIDAVRYKKLSADEATAANINYTSVSNDGNTVYKTVKLGNEYYMPLVINWLGSSTADTTSLLEERLVTSEAVRSLGMSVRLERADMNKLFAELYREPALGYDGTLKFGMYNIAVDFESAMYDQAYQWSCDKNYSSFSLNKLCDAYDKEFPYFTSDGKHTSLSYKDAVSASGGKLGLDYLSMAMVYDAEDETEYKKWWAAFIERWNEILPDIPLYANYTYDIYSARVQGFKTSAFWSTADALLYSKVI